jgi:hypothetical protein
MKRTQEQIDRQLAAEQEAGKYLDYCQECGEVLTDDDDYIDDYGVIKHTSCLTTNDNRHLAQSFRDDPVENDHR